MSAATHTDSKRKADRRIVGDRLSATLALDSPVSSLDEVGPKRAAALGDMGIITIQDLLENYPRRYLDMSEVLPVASARIGQQCTVVGQVHDVKTRRARSNPRLSILEVGVLDATGILVVTCFNQPWLAKRLVAGMRVSVSGKVEFNYGFKRMTNPYVEPLEAEEEAAGLIVPIHPATARVPRAMMRRLVSCALEQVRGCHDPLPLALRVRYRLCSRYEALRAMHEPVSMEEVAMAKRRLVFEELLLVELGLMRRANERRQGQVPFEHLINGPLTDGFAQVLPFELFSEQLFAKDEILAHMAEGRCMDHLLLGDVGTGKTVVAGFALLAAVDSGHQALMMGPTEVLVRQYGTALGRFLDELGVSWGILTGSTDAQERKRLLAACAAGEVSVLFGTHALLEDDVCLPSCSLVCIDEQQRFGVDQRAALAAKAPGCDVLSLTATPIPRSLALALYGDLTLSYLRTRPAASQPRTTTVCHFDEEGIAYDAIREALGRGEQAYIICPLIGVSTDSLASQQEVEEDQEQDLTVEYAFVEWALSNDELDAKGEVLRAATTHARILGESVFPEANVGLLHGKMPAKEKAQVMEPFAKGETDVLVSTTVVEVGVDVPNATVMVIEDADRFGLAQLHQLRGRVGRGEKPGKVFLVSRSKAPQALERLSALEQTDDGFELSERDLSMRKEGDVFGGRQHGRSPLKLVNVVRDGAVIEAAQADARAILEEGLLSEAEATIMYRELSRMENDR